MNGKIAHAPPEEAPPATRCGPNLIHRLTEARSPRSVAREGDAGVAAAGPGPDARPAVAASCGGRAHTPKSDRSRGRRAAPARVLANRGLGDPEPVLAARAAVKAAALEPCIAWPS